ncbi:MAG: S1C family serine protease, partial [Gracilibacteraceae bacterium]|nr:S1C family serine protease [Gracilibacteraceae bacterium]
MAFYKETEWLADLPPADDGSAPEAEGKYEYMLMPGEQPEEPPPTPERRRADLPRPEPARPQGRGILSLALIAFCCALLGALVTLTLGPLIYERGQNMSGGASVTIQQVDAGGGSGGGAVLPGDDSPIVTVAEAVGETVVGIANIQRLRSWFGGGGTELTEVGSGSGFIIDAAGGYIVTNNHVVENAEDLIVSLADGRDVRGFLVGGDARTDLAVVRIEEAEGL